MEIGISATIKKHPYATGGLALGGLVLLFILMRSSGGGGVAQNNNASALQTIAAANAQQAQLSAQVGTAQSQIASQNYTTGLAAQVQNNQTLASQDAANYQTDASLIAALASNQTQQQATQAQLAATAMQVNLQGQNNILTAQVSDNQTQAQLAALGITSATSIDEQVAQSNALLQAQQMQSTVQMQQNTLEAGIQNTQINDALTATENTNQTQLAGYTAGINYQTMLSQLQGALTSQGMTDQTALTSQGITAQQNVTQMGYNYATKVNQNQYNLNNQIVGLVGQAGLNHGTSSLENSLTAILSGVMNQPQIGTSAEQANIAASQASASTTASIMNGITSLIGNIGKGLFTPVASGSQSVLNQLIS